MNNQSDVARMRARITAEHEAGQRALYGLCEGSARHAIINANMERLALAYDEFKALLGEQVAFQLTCEMLEEQSHEAHNASIDASESVHPISAAVSPLHLMHEDTAALLSE